MDGTVVAAAATARVETRGRGGERSRNQRGEWGGEREGRGK